MNSPLRIALGQIAIRMGDKRANCAALLGAVEDAAAAGCDVVVLPECGLAGWLSSKAREFSEPIPGPFTHQLQDAAREHRLAIVAGVEELDNGHVFNTAVFIDERGELRATHRKINELELARPTYSAGKSLRVFEWRGHQVGLLICADCWRPELVDALHAMDADMILSPCAWAVDPGGESTNLAWILETYRQRIGQRAVVIAAANGVGEVSDGPWKGRRLQGNSLLVRRGDHVCGKTNETELLFAEVSPARL